MLILVVEYKLRVVSGASPPWRNSNLELLVTFTYGGEARISKANSENVLPSDTHIDILPLRGPWCRNMTRPLFISFCKLDKKIEMIRSIFKISCFVMKYPPCFWLY